VYWAKADDEGLKKVKGLMKKRLRRMADDDCLLREIITLDV